MRSFSASVRYALLGAWLVAAFVYAQDLKIYQNYDFVPGDKIVFEDDFRADTDGEFPARWKLLNGQGVVNKMDGEPMFALTEGNYVRVLPRIEGDSYLSDPFTVEFDFYAKAGSATSLVFFKAEDDDNRFISFGTEVATGYFEHDLSAQYRGDTENFTDKWHHAALAYKNNQLKCYLDQYRVLVVPEVGFKPKAVRFGGIASPDNPLIFKNVRVANGGGMKLIDRLTSDGKIVSHGILFDVNKATLKPQSMGTLNEIAKMLKENASLKLEIDGHTDSDGDDATNMKLSQSRADAVKQTLVEMGIDGSRLVAKGFGASKPVDNNKTPEGKANNRRVEFLKM